ncbi:ABC transporter substrate-binding protein [Fontimonas sp. SYSU GA230001]|uniref:MlaC/ttg2D family ABC transporter substrate-binding protein n=1 Tax=Fontimonas sp. SYSU GA230001 TaxID=3142450 RepID=UPI0032B5B2F1
MAGYIRSITAAIGAASLALSAFALAAAPDQIIRTATDAARADIAQNVATYQKDKAALYKMVDGTIVPHFDTTYIAKVILGAHIKDANAEQIGQFETAFKDMLIHTYADKMLEYYDGIEIEVKPARIDGKRANVDTVILRKDGKPPVPIVFSMREVDGDWKIWDIKAENISLVLNFRTQIDAEIKKTSIPAVIERLRNGQLVADGRGKSEAKSP